MIFGMTMLTFTVVIKYSRGNKLVIATTTTTTITTEDINFNMNYLSLKQRSKETITG